jgi:hypothetical protein
MRWRLIPPIVSAANNAASGFRLRVGGIAVAAIAITPDILFGDMSG